MELLILLGVLFVYNIVIHKYLHEKYHLLFASSLAIVLIWWRVTQSDIPLGQIGIAMSTLLKGLVYGGTAYVAIYLTIALAVLTPHSRRFFRDNRAISLNIRQLLYKALVNIPIGTVLLEEVVFRGVMLTLLMQQTTNTWAIVISSIFFGMWHILPAIVNLKSNDQLRKMRYGALIVIIGTVCVTFFAGVGLSLLKVMSGSLLAPMMAHYAINSGGLIASWWLHRFKKQA